MNKINPTYVIYAAGISNVDNCEKNKENAYKLHVEIPEQLTTYVNSINSKMLNDLFNSLNIKLDHEEYGATPFLGINGIIMKCHGSSTKRGIKNIQSILITFLHLDYLKILKLS